MGSEELLSSLPHPQPSLPVSISALCGGVRVFRLRRWGGWCMHPDPALWLCADLTACQWARYSVTSYACQSHAVGWCMALQKTSWSRISYLATPGCVRAEYASHCSAVCLCFPAGEHACLCVHRNNSSRVQNGEITVRTEYVSYFYTALASISWLDGLTGWSSVTCISPVCQTSKA